MSEQRADRFFECSKDALALARELYGQMSAFPILSPHGHVNPALLAENRSFVDPVSLLVTPDHYITRMLASRGIGYRELGIPTRQGVVEQVVAPERIWEILAENWIAFAGTPSRIWFEEILAEIFAIEIPFTLKNASQMTRIVVENVWIIRRQRSR